jgi:hypothetical protein
VEDGHGKSREAPLRCDEKISYIDTVLTLLASKRKDISKEVAHDISTKLTSVSKALHQQSKVLRSISEKE